MEIGDVLLFVEKRHDKRHLLDAFLWDRIMVLSNNVNRFGPGGGSFCPLIPGDSKMITNGLKLILGKVVFKDPARLGQVTVVANLVQKRNRGDVGLLPVKLPWHEIKHHGGIPSFVPPRGGIPKERVRKLPDVITTRNRHAKT